MSDVHEKLDLDHLPEGAKVAMISQPMNGKTEEEIKAAREKAIEFLKSEGYYYLDTYLEDDFKAGVKPEHVRNVPLSYLARSLELMSMCDAVLFCPGWEDARGCKVERNAAYAYGLTVIDI